MSSRDACRFLMLVSICVLGASGVGSTAASESKSRSIQVRVTDNRGEPMAEVQVSRSVWTDQADFNRNEKFVTNSDGVAVVTLPETMRILRLWIRKVGFAGSFVNWSESDIKSVPKEIAIVLHPGTTMGGTIVSRNGDPIGDARVEVRYRSGGPRSDSPIPVEFISGVAQGADAALTNDQGHWQVENVPPGDDVQVSLRITHPDFIHDEHWGQLQSQSGVTTKQLRDQTATISMRAGCVARGMIVDPQGDAISDAAISWSRDDKWQVWDNVIQAAEDGRFDLPPMSAGKLFLAVAADGWKPLRREIELGEETEPVVIAMEPGGLVRLKILDRDGKPIPEATITIEGWSGIETPIIYGECKLFEGRYPTKSDKHGVYEWKSAPDETIRLRVSKKGYGSIQCEVAAGAEDLTITLQQAVVISGNVIDDATGQHLQNAQMIPVTHYPQRPNDPIVQRSQVHQLTEATYSYTESGWQTGQELAIQFELSGYRPLRIGPFNEMSGRVTQDIRLQRASPLRGRVVDTAGNPVPHANVSFATKDSSLLVNDWTYEGGALSTRTDENGEFQFVATMSPPVIIATHESGYAEVALDLDEQPGTLRLQPWSRVEGRLLQAGKPVVGNRISLRPIRMLGGDNPHVQDSFWTMTDQNGKFHFDRVPPVPSSMSPYLSVWEECQLTSGYHAPLDLKPGETRIVNFGEKGVVVRGQVKPSGDLQSRIDMNYCLNYLLKLGPGITPPDTIARAGFDWRKGWTFDYRDSQEGLGFLSTLHHHFVKFEPDGTFAIHGVAEGDYQFAISIYEPPEGCLIDPVGLDVESFRVGQLDLERGEVDLGLIEVEVSLGPQVGEAFPNFRYEGVNDEERGMISDLRGRFVLVDFWATWCAPCVKTIPQLQDISRKLNPDQATLLSVSLDEDIDFAREFINDREMDWPQALLGARDTPVVRQQLGISSVPIYYILDPNGILIHRSFQLSEAMDALAKELDATPTTE